MKKKVVLMTLCAMLLVVASVMGTLAYLTSEDSVTNTFTVGQVGITLDEADVKTDGSYETNVEARVDANEYHLIPGHTYIKDPVIHVASTSEPCWLFVKLENGLKDIIAGNTEVTDEDDEETVYTIEAQMAKNGWTCIDENNQIYAYKDVCSAGADVATFGTFTLKDDADVSEYATEKDSNGVVTGGKTIEVTAYAVQADGFEDAQAAWNATFGAPTDAE